MPQAIIEGRIQKKAYAYLLDQYKINHPDFTAQGIRAKVQEIQEFICQDEILHFIGRELNQKSNFDNEYLYQLIDELLTDDVLKKLYTNCSFHPLSCERDVTDLYTIINAFISNKTQEADLRQQDDADRYLRRLDSLARILSINISNSACVAVAIHQGQLFVASNVGGRVSAEEITQTLVKKIAVLKELVNACAATDYLGIYEFCLQPANTDRVFALLGSGVSLSVMQQSLAKVIHVLKTNEYDFCAEFQNAFKPEQPVIVFTPVRKDKDTLSIRMLNYLPQSQVTSSMDLPNTMDHHTRQKDAHAEQILHVFFSQNILPMNPPEPIRVGISKLCCRTCFDVFDKDPRFMVRGTHNNVYLGTLDVRTGARALHNSSYFGTCNPIESGLFSPSKNTLCGKEHLLTDPIDELLGECVDPEASSICCDVEEEFSVIEDYHPVALHRFFQRQAKANSATGQDSKELYTEDPMDLSDFFMFD